MHCRLLKKENRGCQWWNIFNRIDTHDRTSSLVNLFTRFLFFFLSFFLPFSFPPQGVYSWFTAVFHVVCPLDAVNRIERKFKRGRFPFRCINCLGGKSEVSIFTEPLGWRSPHTESFTEKRNRKGPLPRREKGGKKKFLSSSHMGQILCVHKTNSYNIDLSFIFPFCRDTTNIDISFPLVWSHIFSPYYMHIDLKMICFFFLMERFFQISF